MSFRRKKKMDLRPPSPPQNPNDMTEQIINLKSTLETNRLVLKSQVTKQARFKMEKALVNFQTGLKSVVEGENSQQIFGFPNEIWELVFDNFDDATDIQNCFNTCQQFRSSCSSSQKTLIQMRKILPILLGTGYLTHNQILSLRLTCKPINKCVDQFLQSKKLSWKKSFAPIEYDLIPYCYNCSPLEILMQDTLLNVSKGRAIIRYHVLSHPQTRNPFLSRYLMIHDNAGLALERFPQWFVQVRDFLTQWGKEIWYLTLRINCRKSRFLEYLKLMPNLKHLKITGSIKDDGDEYPNNYNKLLQEACPKLTTIVFPGTTRYIAGVHNNLISSFSGRLTEFQVETWECLYSEFYWPNLKKLVISKAYWLIDLCNCRADNLTELRLVLRGSENFNMFLKMVNNFPKLEVLNVEFGDLDKFVMKDEEIIKKLGEDDNVDKVGNKVKRLSLKMQASDNVSFSILACFPMLEYLEIEKEFGKEYKSKEYDWVFGSLKGKDLKKKDDGKEEKVELVEIEKFLCKKEKGNLDQSNVWKILPFLKEVKVNNLSYDRVRILKRPFNLGKESV